MTSTHTLLVPALFWSDHGERDCLDAEAETPKGRRVLLTLSEEAFADLKSDARHYATAFVGEDWAADDYGRSIVRSAKATLAAIQKYEATK
jgi:hypothetical protein